MATQKSQKVSVFYCPGRHTKFVETRHAVFLEDEKMRGSMVAREIVLEVKRVYASTPMIHEPFFSLPAVAAPTVLHTVVPAPVVIPPVATMNDDEDLFFRILKNILSHMRGSNNSLKQKMCQIWRPLEDLKKLVN